jgi:hypothetical protein
MHGDAPTLLLPLASSCRVRMGGTEGGPATPAGQGPVQPAPAFALTASTARHRGWGLLLRLCLDDKFHEVCLSQYPWWI